MLKIMFAMFLEKGYVELCEADAALFAADLIWKEIPFVVHFDSTGLVQITDIRDDGK